MNTQAKIIGAVWFFQVANFLNRAAMSFSGPAIMKSLHMTPDKFGVVLSAFSVGYVCAQTPGGLLSDRWGARLVMVVSAIFWAVFTGLTGLVATLAGFVVVRVCFGLSEGISLAPFYKVIGDNFSSEGRARALAICGTGGVLAPVIGGPIIGYLLVTHGWRSAFFIMSGVAIFAAMAIYALVPRHSASSAESQSSEPAGSLLEVLRSPSFWLISLSFFGFCITYWGYQGWIPSYLALERHIDLKSVGPLASIPFVFAFLGILSLGWLDAVSLHRHRPLFISVLYALAGLSLLFAYRADTVTFALVGLSSAAFFLFGAIAPFGAIVIELAPAGGRATYAGAVNTLGQIGGIVAPAAIGFLLNSTGNFASGFGLMIGGLLASGIALLAVSRHIPKSRPAVPETA